jgi:uncharacterized protein YcbX
MTAQVLSLWRYPVKSLGGERVAHAEILSGVGIPGDRGWALRDEKVGEIRGAKQIPGLLRCGARYLEEPRGSDTPPVEIEFPDGTRLRSDAPAVSQRISEVAGRAVKLVARQPASDTDFYARREPLTLDSMRAMFGLEPGEPLPDLSTLPPEVMRDLGPYIAPLGTLFDTCELHLISTQSLASLAARLPESAIDVRRFRPNLLVDLPDPRDEFPEQTLSGRRLRVGTALLEVIFPMMRCGMVTQPQGELPKDPRILRTLVRDRKQELGAAVRVVEEGVIREGDRLEVL